MLQYTPLKKKKKVEDKKAVETPRLKKEVVEEKEKKKKKDNDYKRNYKWSIYNSLEAFLNTKVNSLWSISYVL